MPVIKHKVYAYITSGERLLVFTQPDAPHAGVQVPGGTVEPGEDPAAAVLREAEEETGLTALRLVAWLGEDVRDMADFGRDEHHARRFYHLECVDEVPEAWEHLESHPSEGDGPFVFALTWTALTDVPPLLADMGAFVTALAHSVGDIH